MASDCGREQNWRQQQQGQSQQQQQQRQQQPLSPHLQAQYVAAGAASPDLEKLSIAELQKFIYEVMVKLTYHSTYRLTWHSLPCSAMLSAALSHE